MIKLERLICYVFLLVGYSFYGQTIKGTVSDESETVPFVTILVKSPASLDKIVQYTETDLYGKYTLIVNHEADSLILEVVSPMYEPQSTIVKGITKGRVITYDFKLEPRLTELKEVIIENRQSVTVKKDTVSFNPEAFRDGSEKVVEDLLKNLPGVRVMDNGEIKYKGKTISKLLLDNDDLFGGQYATGSRNIDVEMVETVQAIEHYNDNPLLKDLVNSDQVVINLKLKSGKTDVSGNVKPGYGITDKYAVSTTAIAVNKKVKAFGVVSYNNIGNNSSPYNFRSSILSVEAMSEASFLAPEVINQGYFFTTLNSDYANINNNLFGSLHSIFKLSPTLSVKTNIGIYDDRLRRNNKSVTKYFLNGETLTVEQTDRLIKKPRVYNAALLATDKPTRDIMWEYNGKITYRDVLYSNLSSNNGIVQNNRVNTENLFTKHDLNFTNRLNDAAAFTATATFSFNEAPQTYLLYPGLNFQEAITEDILYNDQYSRFEKKVALGKARYLYELREETVLDLDAGYSFVQSRINSTLNATTSEDSYTNTDYQNNMEYRFQSPHVSAGVNSTVTKKLKLTGSVKLSYYSLLHHDEIDAQETKSEHWVTAPYFQASYEIGPKYILNTAYSYNEAVPSERNIYSGIILTSYRSFSNNEPDLRFLKTHDFIVNLNYENRTALEKLSGGINYSYRKNNYFYRTDINVFNSISTAFLLPVGNQDLTFNLNGEKYLHFTRTTFQLESSYMLSFSKNIVNNSDLRDVQYRMLNTSISARPAFHGGFNLENKLNLYISSSYLENRRQNTFTNLNDALKLTFDNKGRLKGNMTLTYLVPNTSISSDYTFVDAELTLRSKNKKFEYILTGRNLTNYTRFKTFSISDYYQSESSYNLIGRVVLAEMVFRF